MVTADYDTALGILYLLLIYIFSLYLCMNMCLCSSLTKLVTTKAWSHTQNVSVLHQNSGGIGKSILDPRDFPQASPSGNLLGVGDGFPNTSRVLVEHGYNTRCLRANLVNSTTNTVSYCRQPLRYRKSVSCLLKQSTYRILTYDEIIILWLKKYSECLPENISKIWGNNNYLTDKILRTSSRKYF